jgi:hypothetical protein
MAWYWHRVVPLIRAAGHEPIAVDLPGDDRHCGLATYADIVVRAIAARADVILVVQSLAGFTAPVVGARAPLQMIVFVNAMIPKPGETAGRRMCCALARRTTTPGSRYRFRRALPLRALARPPHACPCGKRRPVFPDRISAQGRACGRRQTS